MPRDETVKSIVNSIQQQLDLNGSKNLLFENAAQIMNIDSSFLAALEEFVSHGMAGEATAGYSELVAFTVKEFVKRVHSINPYLQISEEQIDILSQIYAETWQKMRRTGNIAATLNEFHYPALSKWLAMLYPEKFQEPLRFSPTVGKVTYGEYSAELQLQLLRIDTTHVKQPVLDIGCGGQANLVRYFRSLGLEAYGIDRHIEIQTSYLEQVDWFDYDFAPGQWGTLVAHMSFTNHLNYAYRNDISQLERYLLKMKEILNSLSHAGSFHYAPGLPLIEAELSNEIYQIERGDGSGDLPVSTIARIK